MKIAFICTEKLPSPAIKGGAIQIMIDGIVPFFCEKHEVTVFSITDPRLPDRETTQSVQYIRFPREMYTSLIANELSHCSFDIIHVFNRPKNVIQFKEVSPASSFVLSLHNDMFSPLKISAADSLRAIENVEAITTVSQYIKNTVTGRYPLAESKIHVLYSGVDLSRYSPVWSNEGTIKRNAMRKMFQVEDKKVILFIGRLSKTKGTDVLIESLPYLIPKHPEAMLVIVGGKWFSDNTVDKYVQHLYDIAAPYKNHVIFTGYFPQEKIPDMLAMGDVFVCSSQWHEPLARIHYEAMAAGIPIITTNRGGNAEVIDHHVNGIIVNGYDQPSELAKNIDTVLSNPLLADSLAKQARNSVTDKYQFNHVFSTLEKIYEEIL
jgi:glycosyltransferase involved in cell wall biosynthesis